MAENGTATAPPPAAGAAAPKDEAKKTRRQGVNLMKTKIESPENAAAFVEEFRRTMRTGENDSETRTYNNNGFTGLAFEEIEPEGLQQMIILASDVLAARDADRHRVTAQIVSNTGRRQIETRLIADYTAMARKLNAKANLDDWAKQQSDSKQKKFASFKDLIAVAVEAEIAADDPLAE